MRNISEMQTPPFLTNDLYSVQELFDLKNKSQTEKDWISLNDFLLDNLSITDNDLDVFVNDVSYCIRSIVLLPTNSHSQKGFIAFHKQGESINLEPLIDIIKKYGRESDNGVKYIRSFLDRLKAVLIDTLNEKNIEEYKAHYRTVDNWVFFFNCISS